MMSSILEYDEQAHMEAVHDDGYDEGYKRGASDQKKLTEAECARADAAERQIEELKQKLREANISFECW